MICKKCNTEKSLSDFHNDTKSKTGKQCYCKTCAKKIQNQYYKENKNRVLQRKKIYRNTDEYKKRSREYELEYSKIRKVRGKTLTVRFSMSLRDILKRCLKYKGIKKNSRTFEILGYDVKKFRQRIECQFKDGMCWENYGDWEIDHKKPISKFDKSAKISLINSLCNLQPLWKKDNRMKGNKFDLKNGLGPVIV
jgi:hypothetical protein